MVDGILVAYTIGMAVGLLIGVSIAILVDKASRRREQKVMDNVKKYMEEKNGRDGEESNGVI